MPLTLLTLTIMAVGIYIPFSPLGSGVDMVPLPGAFFPWLAATLLCYCVLTQIVKGWYIRRFRMWL
jgi:Mg2+-importing ATPase